MTTFRLFLMASVWMCGAACAESWMLRDVKTAEAFGPLSPANGATVIVGDRTLVLQISRTKRDQTEALLKRIIIPSIEFRQANLKDVISFLNEASLAADPEREGVNMVLSQADNAPLPTASESSADTGRTITLNLRRVTVYDALACVAEVAGVKWEITEGGVVIVAGTGGENP